MIRVLSSVFWAATILFLIWLTGNALSDTFVVGLLGASGSRLVDTVLLGIMAACSGLILRREWRENPVEESERDEWTNRQLFHSIVFAITFFLGFLSFFDWYFAS